MGGVTAAGILFADKPIGPTSHDLVQRVRRLAATRRVGHAGTLDPAASGLMILGVGPATRLLTHLVGLDKTYTATIRLGLATTTDDAAGTPLGEPADVGDGALERLPAAMSALTGRILQVPSSVSAVHVDGRRAHERVRAGEEVVLPAREVTVSRFELLQRSGADLDVVVDCSSGTYVRALARDLGAALGVGGHLTALRRTRIGPFRIEDAAPLEQPLGIRDPASVASALFPTLELDARGAAALAQGKRLAVPDRVDAPTVAALGPDGALVGLARIRGEVATVLMNLPTTEGAAP
jgi:tRNA pseudouridine55 synthase